jgi:hypothetical protein
MVRSIKRNSALVRSKFSLALAVVVFLGARPPARAAEADQVANHNLRAADSS